ncbi:ankyrin repeat domain-containing protein [Agrococcus jejuensis]|uniref:ankyrin repeat domain-containing protein n=1 Tax=Agrococcus jejuensis TaxID=399736 RepID=UPI0011A61470|nr:ankyrin repeat domain-containing protein [Agrococcus jejuensis]
MVFFRKTLALRALIVELDAELRGRAPVTADRVRELVAKGAKLNSITPPDGRSPLSMATIVDNVPVMRTMLQLGAFPDGNVLKSDNPLHIATINGYRDAARLLLVAGADVNAVSNVGSTALHSALISHAARDSQMAELLVSHGADRNIRDHSGKTPFEDFLESAERTADSPASPPEYRERDRQDLVRFRRLLG